MTSPSVLVAYGTKNGSTAGIADIVATTLRAQGVAVEVREARLVRDVRPYTAVVLGGALYSGRWHRDARRLARRHADQLRTRDVWLFSSGPLNTSADESEIAPVAQVADISRRVDAHGHHTFGGRLAPDARGMTARAMVRNGRAGDFRNPDRIRAWAERIAAEVMAAR